MATGKLRVLRADLQDVYQDIARIPEEYRKSSDGCLLPEGEVYTVTVEETKRSTFVILRGKQESKEQAVWLDERTRSRLGIAPGDEVSLRLERAGFRGEWCWAWNSSDPAYRVNARLALLSVILGFVGALLGAVGLWISLRQ